MGRKRIHPPVDGFEELLKKKHVTLDAMTTQFITNENRAVKTKKKLGEKVIQEGLDEYTVGNIALQIEYVCSVQARYEKMIRAHEAAKRGELDESNILDTEYYVYLNHQVVELSKMIPEHTKQLILASKLIGDKKDQKDENAKWNLSAPPGRRVESEVVIET